MATHDYVLANQSGSSFRTDLNNALAAVVSLNSNSSEPSTKYAYMLWVDTTNNLVKLRNSANNAWITLFTTAGGLDVDAASNFNEDVTFTGASANVTWDKSTDDLIFNDNAKAIFGTSSDGLELFHGSSQSWIKDVGTGNLVIDTDGTQVSITSGGAAKTCARFIKDEGVKLSYNDTIRFETVSDGMRWTGHCYANDNYKLRLGTGEDFELYHDSSHSNIINKTGNLYINASASDTAIVCTPNGKTSLHYDHTSRFETTNTGVQANGNIVALTTGSATSTLTLKNTGGGSDATELQIQNATDSPADGDQTGYIQLSGYDSAGDMTIFNAIIGYMDDVTNGTEDGSLYFYCRDNGSFSQKLKIASDGTFTGSSSNDISDQRLKENIATVVDPITKIKALKGRTFTWKPEAKLPAGTKYGFIAQEVEAVVSDLVDNKNGIRQFDKDDNLIPQDEKAKVNMDEGTTEAKSINALGVVPILVEALKEALTKIETLETKVAVLEAA